MGVPTLCSDLSYAIIYHPKRTIPSLEAQHCQCSTSFTVISYCGSDTTYVSRSLFSNEGMWEHPPGMEASNVINISEDGGSLTGDSSWNIGTGLSVLKVMSLEEL